MARNRLRMVDKQFVRVPIRYGRLSKTRGCSYTMVFSSSLNEEKFGQGIVVPCKNEMTTGQDLVEEAISLWTAETSKGNNQKKHISSDWGCVAVLEKSDCPVPASAKDSWTKQLCKEPCYGRKIISEYGEEIVVDECGFLRISWPLTVDGSKLQTDALLATVTCPTLTNGHYPSAQSVADANGSDQGRKYFCNNRKYGIQTFQDAEIECLWRERDSRSE